MTQRYIKGIAAVGLVAALALAGCSTGGGGATEAPVDDTGAGVLTVASIPNYQTSLPEAIKSFEKANPDIKVNVEFVEVAALHTQLRTHCLLYTSPSPRDS